MKRCPKCGIEYPDTENYCMQCGKPLKKIKGPPTLSVTELVDLLARVGEMEGTLEDMEERISEITPAPELPDDMAKLRSEFNDFVKSTGTTLAELETNVEELQDRVEETRQYELPEDIVELPKVVKKMDKTVSDLVKLKSDIPTLKKNVDERIAEFKGTTISDMEKKIKMMNNVIKNIESRVGSKCSTIEKEMQTLSANQERIELEKMAPGEGIKLPDVLEKQKKQIKEEVLHSVLKELKKGLVG